MNILLVSVLLVLSASTAPAWRIPATQTQINPYVQPSPLFQQQPTTDPWIQRFPVQQGVQITNPGRQSFPVPFPTVTFPNQQQQSVQFPVQQQQFPQQQFPQQQFPQQQFPQDPWQNPGRQQQQGNQCQTLAANGDCTFYDCFNQVKQQCSSQGQFLVNDMQSLCQRSQQLSGRFSSLGRQYVAKVSKCGAKQMTNVMNSQSCTAVNSQAAITLFGQSSSEDCYWQNQLFCNVISNPQDSQAMVDVLFSGNGSNNPQSVAVAEHLQFLSSLCPQSAQNVFQNNFTNRCPPGTFGRQNQPVVFPTQPMMMMGGQGGD